MVTRTRNLLTKSLPVPAWVIVVAAAFGLCHGSFYLDESLDMATAIGVVDFLSVCFGPWLAVHFNKLLMRGYSAWITAILHRMEAITSRTHTLVESAEHAPDQPAHSTLVDSLIGYGCFVTAFFLGGFFTSLLMTILTAQIGDYDYGNYQVAAVVVALIGFGATVAVQCSYFSLIQRKVGTIEREAKRAGTISSNSTPVAVRAEVIGKNIARTEQLGARFVRIHPLSSEHGTI